jgi:hypothetical protein
LDISDDKDNQMGNRSAAQNKVKAAAAAAAAAAARVPT